MDKWIVKSRTVIVGVLGVVLTLLTDQQIITIIPAKYAPYIGAASLILTVILRAIPSDHQGGLTLTRPKDDTVSTAGRVG